MELEIIGQTENLGNSSYYSNSDSAFNNLYPAIVQCFAIISLGYIAGRAHFISLSQAQGIGTYVSKFALPALLFQNMCVLKFSDVNWLFLSSLLVAKCIVFILAAVFTSLLTRSSRIGKAGLYAIFCTQSNDFALGYPIVSALYGSTHPDFVGYLYLVAPVSLVFLNPIGFTMLEVDKYQNARSHSSSLKAVLTVIRGVVLNPIVFMTIFGIIGNFAFHQKVPNLLKQIVQILGDSYSATALFYLGHSLLGKLHKQSGRDLLSIGLLVTAKLLLLPLVCRQCTEWLIQFSSSNTLLSQNTTTGDYEAFSFLYGTFPTAPTVFLYATNYSIALDMIGTGLVVCTLVAAPLMFVSAKMVTLIVQSETDYMKILRKTEFDVSITTIVLSVWVLGVFVLGRRCKALPHQFTICLVLSQVLGAVGVILAEHRSSHPAWVRYVQLGCMLMGTLSTQTWIAVIAVSVCILKTRRLSILLKIRKWLLLWFLSMMLLDCLLKWRALVRVCDSLPFWLTVLMILMITADNPVVSYKAAYTLTQMSYTAVILVVTISSLVIIQVVHNRSEARGSQASATENAVSSNSANNEVRSRDPSLADQSQTLLPVTYSIHHSHEDSSMINTDTEALLTRSLPTDMPHRRGRGVRPSQLPEKRGPYFAKSCSNCSGCDEVPNPTRVVNIEDLVPFPNQSNQDSSQDTAQQDTGPCHPDNQDSPDTVPHCEQYRDDIRCENTTLYGSTNSDRSVSPELQEDEQAVTESRDRHQILRHIILILVLLLAVIAELFAHLLRFMDKDMTGVRVEIEFLNSVLTYGQGILTFLIFGLDTEIVLSPIYQRFRRLCCGTASLQLPDRDDLPHETISISQQFIGHHLDICRASIVGCRRYRLRRYRNVFAGTELVDWLLEVGLANDRSDAVAYGEHLLLGQVIEHVHRQHHFHDLPYLYKFTT